MNNFQVPLTIPVNHETMWGYTAPPHISLCTAPPGAPPHMHSCHMHNVYPSHQLMSQQFSACIPHPHPHAHQGPYGPFTNPPGALSVAGQHYATHQHLPPQVSNSCIHVSLKAYTEYCSQYHACLEINFYALENVLIFNAIFYFAYFVYQQILFIFCLCINGYSFYTTQSKK